MRLEFFRVFAMAAAMPPPEPPDGPWGAGEPLDFYTDSEEDMLSWVRGGGGQAWLELQFVFATLKFVYCLNLWHKP